MSNKYVLRPTEGIIMESSDFVLDLDNYQIGDIIEITNLRVKYRLPRWYQNDNRFLIVDKGYFLWPHNAFMEIRSLKNNVKFKVWQESDRDIGNIAVIARG